MRVPWEVTEQAILKDVSRKASVLMWLGYLVYGAGSALIIALLGDRPITGLLIMMLFQFMVIWMGTRAMYANMSSMLRLSRFSTMRMP